MWWRVIFVPLRELRDREPRGPRARAGAARPSSAPPPARRSRAARGRAIGQRERTARPRPRRTAARAAPAVGFGEGHPRARSGRDLVGARRAGSGRSPPRSSPSPNRSRLARRASWAKRPQESSSSVFQYAASASDEERPPLAVERAPGRARGTSASSAAGGRPQEPHAGLAPACARPCAGCRAHTSTPRSPRSSCRPRARDHVVEVQVGAPAALAAVLAGVVVARVDVEAREADARLGQPLVREEHDHPRHADAAVDRPDGVVRRRGERAPVVEVEEPELLVDRLRHARYSSENARRTDVTWTGW